MCCLDRHINCNSSTPHEAMINVFWSCVGHKKAYLEVKLMILEVLKVGDCQEWFLPMSWQNEMAADLWAITALKWREW